MPISLFITPHPSHHLTIVLTGTFLLSREDLTLALESAGAKVSSSVSRRTSFVIVGESPGSKAEKAAQIGVPCVDLAIFVRALRMISELLPLKGRGPEEPVEIYL